jgi:hypothetical protein
MNVHRSLTGDDHVPANADSTFSATVDIVRNIMGKDLNPHEDLLVLEVNEQKQTVMHHMNRWDLLVKCRRHVTQHYPAVPPASNVHKFRSEFFRALHSDGGGVGYRKTVRGSKAALLQFRDLRCLQGITEPVIHIRKGAIVVSLDPIRAVITSSNMYVVLHEGQDSELQPLVPRLRANSAPHIDGVGALQALPFELQALDAVLYTAFLWHIEVQNFLDGILMCFCACACARALSNATLSPCTRLAKF